MIEELVRDLQQASRGVINDAMIDRGSGWITSLKEEYPLAHALLINLLYKSPEDVLKSLTSWNSDIGPLQTNEHALAYVAAIQKKLRGGK